MKYAVIKVVNGNYEVYSEGFTTPESAKVSFHELCQILWNAPDVITASVAIVDENLDVLDGENGYKEFIKHDAPTE